MNGFETPTARLKLRDDFPPVCYQPEHLLDTLAAELAKRGETLQTAGTIHIAYPHKDPDLFPNHNNTALETADTLAAITMSAKWQRLDGLAEIRSLHRSGKRNAIHALTERQAYTLRGEFSFRAGDRPAYVVVADSALEQGSTMADMISVLTYHGAYVLAAYSDKIFSTRFLPPVRVADPDDGKPANQPVHLDLRLSYYAIREGGDPEDFTPGKCLEIFNRRLEPFHMSVSQMTQGEKLRVVQEAGKWPGFFGLCHDLDNKNRRRLGLEMLQPL